MTLGYFYLTIIGKTCQAVFCISVSINKEYLLNMYDKLPNIFES